MKNNIIFKGLKYCVCIDKYILISIPSRCTKTIGGDMKVTCEDVLTLAMTLRTALETVEQLEIPPSIMETKQQLYLQEKQRQCLEHYRREMNTILKVNSRGMAEDRFVILHKETAERSLLKMGNREDTFGSSETFDSMYSELQSQLLEEGKLFTDLNHTRFQRQESHKQLEAQKRKRVSKADSRFKEALTDLQIEHGKLQEIRRNRENYTTNVVTTVDKHTHHLFGIRARQLWTEQTRHEVTQLDENKYMLAVALQERTIIQHEQRVNEARRELEEAQNDLDTFLLGNNTE